MNDIESLVTEPKRQPGRPPKKGKPTWKPSNVDEVIDKQDGYRYRWCRSDEDNIEKKKAEQWEVDEAATVEQGYGRIDEGKPITSVRKRRDAVLMRMPEDVAQERDAYMNGKTARTMSALKRQAKDDLNKEGAPMHGSITMEKRGIRTVIKE